MKHRLKIRPLLLVSLFCLPLGAFIFLGTRFITNQENIFPFPYTAPYPIKSEILKAQNADVLILGGTQAKGLDRHLEQLQKQLSKNLKQPLNVYNWSRDKETMAITLNKVKSLRKFPMLTIYMGGNEEAEHQKYKLKELPTILENVQTTRNDFLASLTITFPILSRFIYRPISYFKLNTKSPSLLQSSTKKFSSDVARRILELNMTLYQAELEQFLDTFSTHDAKLWIAPSALRLQDQQHKPCSDIDTQHDFDVRKSMNKQVAQGKVKEALSAGLELVLTSPSNSSNYTLLAKTMLKNGEYEKARSAYYHAAMYDCTLSYDNPLYLKILLEAAESRDINIINFNQMVLGHLGSKKLFFDRSLPQNIYYQQFIDQLEQKFNQSLRSIR